MIKVHIRRTVSQENQEQLVALINQLRAAIAGHSGYLSSETLRQIEPPGEVLVVSKWQSRYYWEQWYASPERAAIQEQIDMLIESATRYEVFEYL